jgi:prepilin-type processing-associated H-X9-DG protein
MSTAIVASVRAIVQAHTAFSGAAFGTVLFADGRVEGQGGDRQNSQIKQCG